MLILFIVYINCTIQHGIIYKISQIAADYAKLKYQDFAVVIQPFFSKAKADLFPVEFLSNVCSFIIIIQNYLLAIIFGMIHLERSIISRVTPVHLTSYSWHG